MLATIYAVSLAVASLSTESPASDKPSVQQGHNNTSALSFHELLEPSAHNLKPSVKLLSLNGKRVRLVGFMAKMETPPLGAFYLTPRPVACDEGGAGTGDLPPDAVRVVVRSASGQVVPFLPGALEVTGVLEVGHRTEEDGGVSAIRLVLDRPEDLPRSARARAKPKKS